MVVAFVVFAALIGTLVYKCSQQNFELVSKDYYNDELRYQDKIDGANNANKLSAVAITQTPDVIQIKLPKELQGLAITGEAWFYCPVNSKNDRRLELKVNDEGVMSIPGAKILAANYQVKVNWQIGKEKFFNEQTFTKH